MTSARKSVCQSMLALRRGLPTPSKACVPASSLKEKTHSQGLVKSTFQEGVLRSGAAVGGRASTSHMARPTGINPFSINLLAGCIVLASLGAIPAHDVVFSLAWPAYIAAINCLRFDNNRSQAGKGSPGLVSEDWVKQYAGVGGVLAILVPGALCVVAAASDWSRGKTSVVLRTLGPHLYLIAAQVICESFSSNAHVAMLPRMLVPIGFNTYRMWTLVAWCRVAVAAKMGPLHVGLAVSNVLFWAFNLFVFLLLKMVPQYLDPAKTAV